jgi:hypothetical protein
VAVEYVIETSLIGFIPSAAAHLICNACRPDLEVAHFAPVVGRDTSTLFADTSPLRLVVRLPQSLP